MEAKAIKFKPRQVTEEMIKDYLNLNEVIKDLEKKKDEIRSSIMYTYPEGGVLSNFLIFIETQTRRSFPLDEVKAKVDELSWAKIYEPFIKITPVTKLIIKQKV